MNRIRKPRNREPNKTPTPTGRTVRDLPLQNIPLRTELGRQIRDAFKRKHEFECDCVSCLPWTY